MVLKPCEKKPSPACQLADALNSIFEGCMEGLGAEDPIDEGGLNVFVGMFGEECKQHTKGEGGEGGGTEGGARPG